MPDSHIPIEVFCSYAPADEPLFKKLEVHLSLLKREGLISTWHNRQIVAGTDWNRVIDAHLEQASIILLLVSPDFFASDYCYEVEMQRALQRHTANKARVIPIVVRSCSWKRTPLAQLQCLPHDGKPVTMQNHRDAAWNDVTVGIRHAIEDLPLHSVSTSDMPLSAAWNIPYPQDPLFIGREDELRELANMLQVGHTAALTQPQAISGLGGIGKTQLAVAYAYQYARHYQAVFWIPAETRETFISGLITLAEYLQLPQARGEQEDTVKAVQSWLQTHTKWLLILDNVEDFSLLRAYLPPAFGGHVILTTRTQTTGRFAQRIAVQTLESSVGGLLLLRRAGLLPPTAQLAHATEQDAIMACKISDELGGLPLALDQAGAYIEETQCSLAHYLKLYQTRQKILLQRRGNAGDNHPEPVATTWSLAFAQVERRNHGAADMLRFCAFLNPDDIPEEIFLIGANALGPHLMGAGEEALVLDEAIAVLGAYSLVRRDASKQVISIHRLVQVVLKEAMGKEEQEEWAKRTVQVINAAIPSLGQEHYWSRWARIIGQVVWTCIELVKQHQLLLAEAALLLLRTGDYFEELERHNQAELSKRGFVTYTSYEDNQARPFYEQALQITEMEQEWETPHLQTARDATDLGRLYQNKGKYELAELQYLRAISIVEQQLKLELSETPQILEHSVVFLEGFYRSQGMDEQIESLLLRVLSITEQLWGPEHPETATSLNYLGVHYHGLDRCEQAEPLLLRALAIREQHLGLDYSETAQSLNNLGALYHNQGKYEQAEPLYLRALSIRTHIYPDLEFDKVIELHNLANVYAVQGKYEQAEPFYQRILAFYERHPSEPLEIALCLLHLAQLYYNQNKYEQAEPLYQRVLTTLKQKVGQEHPHSQLIQEEYVSLLQAMGRNEEAAMLKTDKQTDKD